MPITSRAQEFNDLLENDPALGWVLKPNLNKKPFTGTADGQTLTYHVSTNDLALRNPPVHAKGPRFRILAIGDSTTFGQFLEDEQTWPAQLEAILDKDARRVEVINAGLIGASSFQGLCYVATRGIALEPDLVVVTYGFNDWALSPYADRDRARMRSEPALALLLRSALRRIGVLAPENPASVRRVSDGEYLDNLIGIHSVCRDKGIAVLYLIWPGRPELQTSVDPPDPYRNLVREAARITQSPCLDLLGPFRQATEPVFLDLVHATPYGCRVTAEAIAQKLREESEPLRRVLQR